MKKIEIFIYQFDELTENSQMNAISQMFNLKEMSYSMADDETIEKTKDDCRKREWFDNGFMFGI